MRIRKGAGEGDSRTGDGMFGRRLVDHSPGVRASCARSGTPTGCRLDRDAAGLKEARRRRGGPPDANPAGRLAELELGGAHYVARCMMNIAATA